jgi:CubicO group peptidase (beta-lactamase class C family)
MQVAGSAMIFRAMLSCAAMLLCAQAHASTSSDIKHIIARAKETHSAAVMLWRDGKMLTAYRDDAVGTPADWQSATKSIAALGVGLLLRDGKLESLDVPVYRFYPEWKQGRKQLITIRMLLNQVSGLQDEERASAEIQTAHDVVQLALAAEIEHDPGEVFFDGNKAVNLLMGIIARAAGAPADEYLQHALFAPLGISDVQWMKDAAGNVLAMTGLELRPEDAVKIGRLVLGSGNWNGTQIVPDAFVRELLDPGASMPTELRLLWWRTPAWIQLSVDAASVDLLRELDVPETSLTKIAMLIGQTFSSSQELVTALQRVLSEAEFASMYDLSQRRSVRMGTIFHLQLGPAAAYSAIGEFGQYIVVVPAAKLVAVRLGSAGNIEEADAYDDFIDRVVALAGSLERKR